MRLELITAPSEEPVSVADAKGHLRIEPDATAEDDYLQTLVWAAIGYAEHITHRALCTQTWRLTLDEFPRCGHQVLELPRPKLQSVASIKYVASDGVLTTISSSDYVTNPEGLVGTVRPAYGKTWPSPRSEPDAVRIEFVAGYGGATDVPQGLQLAIKQLVAHWYESREPIVTGTSVTKIPLTLQALFWAYRVPEVS